MGRHVHVVFTIPDEKQEDNGEVMQDVLAGMEERGYVIDSIIIHSDTPVDLPDMGPMIAQIRDLMKGPKEP